jgi:hypothetical protein
MLLVGLVDKICFKTLFVACKDLNYLWVVRILKTYICIVLCYIYVCMWFCDIDLIASRHNYHLVTLLLGTPQIA